MPTTDANTPSQVPSDVAMLLIASGLLIWLYRRYLRPAVTRRPAAARLDRYERLRLIGIFIGGASVSMTTYVTTIWPSEQDGFLPSGAAGLVFQVGVPTGVGMCVLAFAVRTLDRHKMHARHQALELGRRRAPWWPSAASVAGAGGILALFAGGSYIFWTSYPAHVHAAAVGMIDRSPAAVALQGSVIAHVRGYAYTLLGLVVLAAVVGVIAYKRQIRRVARYNIAITQAVSDAASMTLP